VKECQECAFWTFFSCVLIGQVGEFGRLRGNSGSLKLCVLCFLFFLLLMWALRDSADAQSSDTCSLFDFLLHVVKFSSTKIKNLSKKGFLKDLMLRTLEHF
jgi:hypothetical protein